MRAGRSCCRRLELRGVWHRYPVARSFTLFPPDGKFPFLVWQPPFPREERRGASCAHLAESLMLKGRGAPGHESV